MNFIITRMFFVSVTALCLFSFFDAVDADGPPQHYPATTTSPTVKLMGGGSTGTYPLWLKWSEGYAELHPDVQITYLSIGSRGGIKGIVDQTFLFGVSDLPVPPQELEKAKGKILHIPTAFNPVAIIYNLPDAVGNIRLDSAVLSGIYLGRIKNWNDPAIQSLNPKVNLPNLPIVVINRHDGSAVNYVLTSYLSKASSDWSKNVGVGSTVKWPVGVSVLGGHTVDLEFMKSPGAISIVELLFAQTHKFRIATLVNHDGKDVLPSLETVASSLDHIDIPDNLILDVIDAPGENSYPLIGVSYTLIYDDLKYMQNMEQAKQLTDFLLWCLTDGQEIVKPLDYVEMPAKPRNAIVEKIKKIKIE